MSLAAVREPALFTHSCSCTAGQGFCNHLTACLYQTAHYVQLGLQAVPFSLACTSQAQTWHRPRSQVCSPYLLCPLLKQCNPVETRSRAILYISLRDSIQSLFLTLWWKNPSHWRRLESSLLCTERMLVRQPLKGNFVFFFQPGSYLTKNFPQRGWWKNIFEICPVLRKCHAICSPLCNRTVQVATVKVHHINNLI